VSCLGIGITVPLCINEIVESLPMPEVGPMIGAVSVPAVFFGVIAPLIGGLLASLFGWRGVFSFFVVYFSVQGVLTFFFYEEDYVVTRIRKARLDAGNLTWKSYVGGYISLVKGMLDEELLPIALARASAQMAFAAGMVILASTLPLRFGFGPSLVGGLSTAASAGSMFGPILGSVGTKIGVKMLGVYGLLLPSAVYQLCEALFMLLFGVAVVEWPAWVMVVMLSLGGFFFEGTRAGLFGFAAFIRNDAPEVLALVFFYQSMASFFATALVFFLASLIGIPGTFALFAAFMSLVAFVLLSKVARHLHRRKQRQIDQGESSAGELDPLLFRQRTNWIAGNNTLRRQVTRRRGSMDWGVDTEDASNLDWEDEILLRPRFNFFQHAPYLASFTTDEKYRGESRYRRYVENFLPPDVDIVETRQRNNSV